MLWAFGFVVGVWLCCGRLVMLWAFVYVVGVSFLGNLKLILGF
jgi:hypothetical protein